MTAHAATATLRRLGAIAVLLMGVDHLQQFYGAYYDAIPTIGTLFVLNFASSTAVGLGLLAPLDSLSKRWGPRVLRLLALAGVGIAGGSLAGLLVSEQWGLFGFMEAGYRQAIVVSIAAEAAAIALLGAYLVAARPRRPAASRGPRSTSSNLGSWRRPGETAR
jgi:hypothetical protein